MDYLNSTYRFRRYYLEKAYNDATKIQYKLALENSINDKVTEAKEEYFNNPTLRNDTNNLKAILNDKLTRILCEKMYQVNLKIYLIY